jgi:hypothetical protein
MWHEELEAVHRNPNLTVDEKITASLEAIKHYVDTMDVSVFCKNANILTNDLLYMIGVAINPQKYRYGSGFQEFKSDLEGVLSKGKKFEWGFDKEGYDETTN